MRRSAVIFVMLMMVQATLPMAANAQTNPPQGSGDWTIPAGDVTYFNNSQALIQGNLNIYGTLIVEDSNIFLWGANNGDREINIYSGGELYFNNSVLSSYTAACLQRMRWGFFLMPFDWHCAAS